MTPKLARAQNINVTIRRRNATNPFKRSKTTGMKRDLSEDRTPQQSIVAAPSSSWDCAFTSWTTVNIVEMSNSEICSAEFASWTILDEDIGNELFLSECMNLFGLWCWWLEEIDVSSDTVSTVFENDCNSWMEDNGNTEYRVCTCDCDEIGMAMYGMLMDEDEDEEEVIVEPETNDSHLMAALLSTKDLLPSPSGGAMRAFSCPDLLVSSLAALLFETRHLQYINERMDLPTPPKWMAAMEAIREMDPPNSLVSTVSLPSGWDTVSARQSSSSIFNLFSDPPVSPIPSLFDIDSTGAPSTVSGVSTVSVPQSFWNTSSTVSVAGSTEESSIVSIPSTFFIPQEVTSSTSSLFNHPSMFGGRNSSTTSSLFMDPSSAHSSSSIFSIDPSGSTSSSSLLSSLISTSASFCSACQLYHSEVSQETMEDSESYSDDEEHLMPSSSSSGSEIVPNHRPYSLYVACTTNTCNSSRSTYTISNASSGYETDVDVDESIVLRPASTTSSTQTEALKQTEVARMLAECDNMLEKLVEMRKKLEQLL